MDLTSQAPVETMENGIISNLTSPLPTYMYMVDSFLVEALQNPRHRLTILRMELDVQKFLQSTDSQFEFPHFPTSYLRLAAHRVAQHYGLQTMVQDNITDGQGTRILVLKKPESNFPAFCLSDVPAKEPENGKLDEMKFVIRPRPKASSNDNNALGLNRSPVRSVEERKEEYDKARARIFSSPRGSEPEDVLARGPSDDRNLNVNEQEFSRNLCMDMDASLYNRDMGNSSRVAILRDREKDRTDPDYDRSRYVKSIVPNTQSFNIGPFNMQPPYVQYDTVFTQSGQASMNYRVPVMSPSYCATGFDQQTYMHWPSQSMMYAQSYDPFFQNQMCQQPLSFDYSQSHHR